MPESKHTTLIELVKHYSPSGEEAGAVAWLVARMEALGYERAFRDAAGNAVGVIGAGPRQVVLLGHIDTVPGEIAVRVEGERLYGRGAVDAKGPLACFVDAAARLGAVAGWQWVVIAAVEEERNSEGARFVRDQYRPDFLIVGEPSGWQRVTLGYKGSLTARVEVRRAGAHAAGGQASACDAAIQVWDRVRAFARQFNHDRERVFDQVSPSLLGMESGGDGFEDWARLTIGTRLPVGLSPQEWLDALQGMCAREQAVCTPLGFPIPAYRAAKNTPLVRAFLKAIRKQGGKPGFVVKTGTADLNILAPAWGCPALVYGPGDAALDHTPDEHISLPEYERAVIVLAEALRLLTR